MKPVLQVLIFSLQALGAVLIGVGLGLIWSPLVYLYAGAASFAFGHLLYLAVKSEGTKK